MKLYKRSGTYQASNVDFDPATGVGRSYGHWHLTRKIGDTVYLNVHPYSKTTIRHIAKVRAVLQELGIRYIRVSTAVNLRSLDYGVVGAELRDSMEKVEDLFKLIRESRQDTAIALTRKAKLTDLMTLVDNLTHMRDALNSENAKDDLVIWDVI